MSPSPFRIIKVHTKPSIAYLISITSDSHFPKALSWAENVRLIDDHWLNMHDIKPIVIWVSADGCELPNARCILADMTILTGGRVCYTNLYNSSKVDLTVIHDNATYYSLFTSHYCCWSTRYQNTYRTADWVHILTKD